MDTELDMSAWKGSLKNKWDFMQLLNLMVHSCPDKVLSM